jgi:hypothetical protein
VTTRRILNFEELARELTTRIVVIPVPTIRGGRVVLETATEKDFGPRMRRTTVIAAAPKTLMRAHHYALNNWGEGLPEWDRSRAFLVSGRKLLIPLDVNPGGYIPVGGYEPPASVAWHEWAVRL